MQAVLAPLGRISRRALSSTYFWLALILLLAWGLRLAHLGTMSVWWDESLSYARATGDIPSILANTIQIQRVVTRDLHPPLYFILLHFALRAFGASEFGLRVLSALTNVLTIALLFALTQALVRRRRVGLLVALFAALSPFYVWYSQEARPYALVLLWSVLAAYALVKWLRARPRTLRAVLSPGFVVFVLALGLTLFTHYLSFVLLPFYAAALLLYGARGSGWRERARAPTTLLALGMIAAFALILFLVPRSAAELTGSDTRGPQFVPFFIMLRDVWNSFAVGVTANLDDVALVDLLLVVLWVLGVAATVRVSRRERRIETRLALFLSAFFLLPALALQLGSYLRPLYLNSRHLITTSPAFYLGIALGVDALASRLRTNGGRRTDERRTTDDGRRTTFVYRLPSTVVLLLASAVFAGGALYSLNNLYFNPAYAKDDHKAWAEFLRERMRPDDFLILVAPQAEKVYEYYAPPGLAWQSLPNQVRARHKQEVLDRQAVLDAYRNHARVWFLEIHQPVGDPAHHIADLLNRWGEALDIVYFPGISTRIILQQFVYHSAELDPKTPIAHPTQIAFDENLALVGYDAPAQVVAGGHDAVKLYWRLKDKTPNDLGVSVRVVDQNGVRWGQWDAPPIGNLHPTSTWDAGVTYVDQHDLVVDPGAPPGRYSLELSVYREGGRDPVAVQVSDAEPTDAPVRLASLQITRPEPPRDPKTLIVDEHADVPFGDAVKFVGYDYAQDETGPGSTLPLTLYFQLLKNGTGPLRGQVALTPPFWEFWNAARGQAPLTLDLANRLAGEIVQTNVELRVPVEARAGSYDLSLAIDGYSPQAGWMPHAALAFGSTQVASVARATALPAMSTRLAARLGDQVELLGYDLRAPQPLEPNDDVTVTLYWRALKPMDTSYKVFTHLINSANEIFGQNDSLPVQDTRPTTSWAPGEVLTDVHRFQVAPNAPPGRYQVEVGLYDPVSGARLPVFDSSGHATGDRILFAARDERVVQ